MIEDFLCAAYSARSDSSRIRAVLTSWPIVGRMGGDGGIASPAGPVALGHRRLAIIDVSDAGLQPMADPSGRYQLVFNGEFYNYLELREELRRPGEIFTTETDSEVLLRAYMVWGEAALDRCLGMFAFLIWDKARSDCSSHATASASSRSI